MPDHRNKRIIENLRSELGARGLKHPDFAVVIPVVFSDEGVHLLIEVRAAGISQAGDPCFPGGRIERGETPAEAAAREMFEELNISVDPAAFFGQLPTVDTFLGSRTDVFVCGISKEDTKKMALNPAEVSELLLVPLEYFLEKPNAANYPYRGHTIWGMTAGAIRYFCAAWKRAAAKEEKKYGSL